MREWIIWYDDIMSEHTSGELVRCKDCKFAELYKGKFSCSKNWNYITADWFCADGERKDDGENREDDL